MHVKSWYSISSLVEMSKREQMNYHTNLFSIYINSLNSDDGFPPIGTDKNT